MTSVNLVMDTCVLSDSAFIKWAARETNDIRLMIPSVVYMERRRQLINNRKDPASLDRMLRTMGITVIPFDKNVAGVAADLMSMQTRVCPHCGKLDWVDVMVLASIGNALTLLVTRNKTDFMPYGFTDRIKSPEEVSELCAGHNRRIHRMALVSTRIPVANPFHPFPRTDIARTNRLTTYHTLNN